MSDRKFKWRGEEAVKNIEEVALKAMRTGAEAILTEAIDEAPFESGTLRRSGTVTVGGLPDGARVFWAAEAGNGMKDAFSDPVGEEKSVYISFNTPYARRQHEDLTLNHPRGGKAKYLEDPFKRNAKKVERLVVQRVKAALDRKE